MVRTKIIATIGPASNTEKILRKMILSGLDIVRLNFSHGTYKDHAKTVNLVYKLNKKLRRAIKVMQDLEGFRIRIGRLRYPLNLHKRSILYFTKENIIGENNLVHLDYPYEFTIFKRGMHMYINDGRIILKIRNSTKKVIKSEVITEGILDERKGVNIPGAKLRFSSLTDKDKKDISFIIPYSPDFIAQSFVRCARDISYLKKIIKPRLPNCKIFAKIESQEGLKNLNDIIRVSEGIIIARGDLGVCVPIYKVPIIQKEIIKKCRLANKPVVVATQMLESMVKESLPTRAEVTDVANAIFDGANFVMLSSETTIGKHPHKVVEMMNKIIKYAEKYKNELDSFLI